MKPVVYLKKQLEFTPREWAALPQSYKDWYKSAAVAEMTALGIEVTPES